MCLLRLLDRSTTSFDYDLLVIVRGPAGSCAVATARQSGLIDSNEIIRSARTLGGAEEAHGCFRRAVFNLLTTHRDDQGRKHAFLYHGANRTRTLSPAYDLNPNVANVLIALRWLGSPEIPTRFEQLTRLAEIGGISARAARTIYRKKVEAATLGGRRTAAAYAGVPEKMTGVWYKEMIQQTKLLWQDARRPVAAARTRSATPKLSPINKTILPLEKCPQ